MAADQKSDDSESKRASQPTLSRTELAATKQYSSPDEIDIDIARYRSQLQNTRPRPVWFYSLIALVGAAAGYLGAWKYFHSAVPSLPQFAVTVLCAVVPPLVVLVSKQIGLDSLRTALDILEVRKRNMTPSFSGASRASSMEPSQEIPFTRTNAPSQTQGPSDGYFNSLVDINVKNLGDYYGLVRLHNNKSFNVSVAAGFVGFVLIVAAIAIVLLPGNKQTLPAAISAGSGVITEFISAVFFYLYNRSVREMRDYFESLLTVQNILLSLKLVADTQDEKEKIKMVGLMLSYLVDRKAVEPQKFAAAGSADDLAKPQPEKVSERVAA